jgi:hypothetical protein
MQNISEIKMLIDEMEHKINSYGDKTVWQKSNSSDWYTFVTESGPKIIESWRELAALVRLTPGDQLLELVAKLESIQAMVANADVMQLAMKLNQSRTVAPQEPQ